jgi:hypothetical protein
LCSFLLPKCTQGSRAEEEENKTKYKIEKLNDNDVVGKKYMIAMIIKKKKRKSRRRRRW